MSRILACSIALGFVFLAGCIPATKDTGNPYGRWINPLPDTPEVAERGASLFRSYCSSCHGSNADGQGPAAPRLKTTPTDLRYGNADGAQLFTKITLGKRGTSMPAFGQSLSVHDRAAMVRYLQTFPGNEPLR